MDLTPDRKAIRILRRAHELMNNDGSHWIRGEFKQTVVGETTKLGEPVYAYCSVGAINQAVREFGYDNDPDASLRAKQALAELLRQEHVSIRSKGLYSSQDAIIRWNDSIVDGWSTVSATFKRAIANLKAA